MAVFWVVAPCRLVGVYRRFRGMYCLQHQGDGSSLVNSHQSTRRCNPADGHNLNMILGRGCNNHCIDVHVHTRPWVNGHQPTHECYVDVSLYVNGAECWCLAMSLHIINKYLFQFSSILVERLIFTIPCLGFKGRNFIWLYTSPLNRSVKRALD
jgi:hypothetical protein